MCYHLPLMARQITRSGGGEDRRPDLKAKHIDYFQSISSSQSRLRNCFGIRVRDGSCCKVIQVNDEPPSAFGETYRLPINVDGMPNAIRMIVDDHVLNYPHSDLIDILTGKQSFQKALNKIL